MSTNHQQLKLTMAAIVGSLLRGPNPNNITRCIQNSEEIEIRHQGTNIQNIAMKRSNLSDGVGRHLFVNLDEEQARNLQSISLEHCRLGGDGLAVLKSSLKQFKAIVKVIIGITDRFDCDLVTNMIDLAKGLDNIEELKMRDEHIYSMSMIISGREIKLYARQLSNELLASLLSTARPHYDLKELDIAGGPFGLAGCETVSTLLQDQTCNVVCLHLNDIPINEECAILFANALKNNRTLEQFRFERHEQRFMGRISYNAFANALCDPTSINTIQASNHALKVLGHEMIPNIKIQRHLAFNNRSVDKKEVAIYKILRYHKRFDVSSLFEWELKFLPIAVNWFDSAGVNLDLHKIDVIYQFILAMAEFLA